MQSNFKSKFRSWKSAFAINTPFVHLINFTFQASIFAVESESCGKVRTSSVRKRLQIVSARRWDPLELDKAIVLEFVHHGVSLKVCNFVEVVGDGEIQYVFCFEEANL